MSDRPQGPGWWQASDLNWYPPEKNPNYAAPASPPPTPATPTQPRSTRKGPSGPSKGGFIAVGLALVLVIAALVTGRVLLGNFLPGLLLVAAIAIIGVTVVVRSGRPAARKAMLVSAMALVVALAVPASLKVVYPVYHHFAGDGSSQASPSPQASPPPQAPLPSNSPTAHSSPPTGSPNAGAPQFKIVVAGQTIDPAAGCAAAGCRQSVKVFCKSSMNGTSATFEVTVGPYAPPYAATAILTTGNPPTAVRVNLVQFGGKYWAMQQSDTVTVTKSGNAYTMTGTITPTGDPINAQGVLPTGPAVPFEYDATCP
jgi:Mycobacterium 19 kDa lipoprotein antigen